MREIQSRDNKLKKGDVLMTGRDFILYILSNGLEDTPIYENGKLLGFMTPMEAAIKFGVGVSTVDAWCNMGMLPCVKIGDTYFIPELVERPFNGGRDA